MKIDFQTHIAPLEYGKELSKRKVLPYVKSDGSKSFIVYGEGCRYPITENMYAMDKRIEDMDASGIDMQCLSLGIPGTDCVEPDLGISLAKMVNDEISRFVDIYPDRFVGLATLPLQDIDGALDELDRSIKDLGFKGVMIYSNVSGEPLDSTRLWPFYEKSAKLKIPIFIHPTLPVMAKVTRDYELTSVIGFLFDTTLAMLRIIFGGVLEKFPSLIFILPHLGSTIPYVLARIDRSSVISPGSRANISKPPSKYFIKSVYVDTVSLHEPALKCAYQTLGIDRLLFGSDYPLWDIPSAVESIERWEISEEEKDKIYYKNAIKILRLKL